MLCNHRFIFFKSKNGTKVGEVNWFFVVLSWEVKKQLQKGQGKRLNSICRPIRRLCCLRAGLISRSQIQSNQSLCLSQAQAARLLLWICVFFSHFKEVTRYMKTTGSNWFSDTNTLENRRGMNHQQVWWLEVLCFFSVDFFLLLTERSTICKIVF